MASRKRTAQPAAAVEPGVAAPEVVEETVAAPAEDNGKSVTVTWHGGSRVYSKEVHGKDFKALAKEFAGKPSIKGTIA